MKKTKRKELKTKEKNIFGNKKKKSDRNEIIKHVKEKKDKIENIDKLKKKLDSKKNKKYKEQMKDTKVVIDEKYGDISRRKRMKIWIFIVILIYILYIIRIGWIQFGMGDWLKEMALEQQSLDRAVNPRRGTIYDATGTNILAVSSTVNTITVNPGNNAKENKEKVAETLRTIFELEYEDV